MRRAINSNFAMCSPDSGVFEPELGGGLHGGDEAGVVLLFPIPEMFDGQQNVTQYILFCTYQESVDPN